MAVFKVLVEIQGNLFDLWNLKSLTRSKEYNDIFGRMDYNLWINKDAMILEFKDIKFTYPSESEREKDYERIKEALDNHDTVLILNDTTTPEKEFVDKDDIDDEHPETIQEIKDEEENS